MAGPRAAFAVLGFAFLSLILSQFDHHGVGREGASSPQEDIIAQNSAPQGQPDLTSLLQGRPIIDLLSMSEGEKAAGPAVSIPKAKKTVSLQISSAFHRQHIHTALLDATHRLGESTNVSSSTAGVAIVLLVVLVGCTCLAALSFVCPMPFGSNNRRDANTNPQETKEPTTVLEQRDRMLVNITSSMPSPMSSNTVPGTGTYQRSTPANSQPATGNLAVPLRDSQTHQVASPVVGHAMPATKPRYERSVTVREMEAEALAPTPTVKPPPLCPSLVMPASEARLGIPMFELAQVNAEGRLNIVGITGKPLLRAMVHKIGASRTLEISMPEENTVPRATIAPAALSVEGERERAMEIRGTRGAFYGILEMRSSGACYVVKDGQTVLTIDGDAESLQLALKSSVGVQLAAVRCSADLFDGIDHVEIRVEPGVDTVLVIGVVLAVLLLSPYLPPADEQHDI